MFHRVCVRRNYYQYKLGEQQKIAESLETATKRDVVLFRYEDPYRIMRYNIGAAILLPLWTYLGYFSYSLKKQFLPLQERFAGNWVYDNVVSASTGVGLGFFLFGVGISSYWFARNMSTVRRLILRKGGRHATIISYGLYGTNSVTVTVPVVDCSLIHRPFQAKYRLFMRVKDVPLKYQLNVEHGTFANKPLFDRTLGVGRKI